MPCCRTPRGGDRDRVPGLDERGGCCATRSSNGGGRGDVRGDVVKSAHTDSVGQRLDGLSVADNLVLGTDRGLAGVVVALSVLVIRSRDIYCRRRCNPDRTNLD